ncbi:hypothetical protein D3C85_1789270 [compost metagenome]
MDVGRIEAIQHGSIAVPDGNVDVGDFASYFCITRHPYGTCVVFKDQLPAAPGSPIACCLSLAAEQP